MAGERTASKKREDDRRRRQVMARRKDPGPRSLVRFTGRAIPGSRPAPHPGFVEPALAVLRDQPPRTDKYVHEIKFDGYRIQAHLHGGLVSLWTRGGLDWTQRFMPVATGVFNLPATDVVIGGEIISANEAGAANFSALQDDLSRGRTDRMVYYAFDILYLDGFDLRPAPLIERKRVLAKLITEAKGIGPVKLSEHFEEDAEVLFKQACDMSLEGMVSKLRDAPYRSGRNEAWLKIKCAPVGRFEVIGYKVGAGSATSLYLGKRQDGALLYAGKAGSGYTGKMTTELRKLMDPITIPKSPLTKKAGKKIDRWVKPTYWAEVDYRDVTSDGLLRHVVFRGLYASRNAKKPIVTKFKKPISRLSGFSCAPPVM